MLIPLKVGLIGSNGDELPLRLNGGKPSDGLRMKFPRYTYDDMVAAQYRLLTEGLGVNHLSLLIGTSMGGMHAWVWGQAHPDFMDGLSAETLAAYQKGDFPRSTQPLILLDTPKASVR